MWSRALHERGPGLHHVAFTEVVGFDAVAEDLAGAGFDLTVAGRIVDERWC